MSKLGLSGLRSFRGALVVFVALGLVVTLATGAGAASKRSKAAKRVAARASAFAKQDSARISGAGHRRGHRGKDAGKKSSSSRSRVRSTTGPRPDRSRST